LQYCRSSQEVVLVDPVENRKAEEDENGSKWHHTRIEIGEPKCLQDFAIPLAHQVFRVFHELVGLLLGDIRTPPIVASLEILEDVPRIYNPDSWHQEGLEVKHDSLLLYQTILRVEESVLGKALDYDAEKRSGEEEAQSVLKSYMILVATPCFVAFEVDQVVDDGKEHEFIEEYDKDKSGVGEEACPCMIDVGLFWIFIDLLQLVLDYLVLVVKQEVENYSENSQRQQENTP
jgi:hypothetical protein